jgi:two-component system, cell cycle sensor histidine kinase DivJ
MQLSPVIDEATHERHEVIALLRDISARKDAEAAMAEARRAAEDASQAKSRFLATIGHELRTPLNAVIGFSEMMTKGIGGDLSPTHREYAGLIHQSSRHLLEVVGMLLDMSRIEAGKFEIQAEPMVAAEIVPACFGMVEALAQERGVQLVSEIERGLPQVIADERVCRQILINLLSNAIKFSHEGGLVTVAVRRQGQSINFSVRDRGIGMAPAAMARIGEPFFQVQDGLSRKYEGTGLGLSIVKGLVELHGGTLRVMSEIGAGTTITVLLPINGPATKPGETAEILPLYREPVAAPDSWPNEKRKAQ